MDRIANALNIDAEEKRKILRDGLNEAAERHGLMIYFREGPTAGEVSAALRDLRAAIGKANRLTEDLPGEVRIALRRAYQTSAILEGPGEHEPDTRLRADLAHLGRLSQSVALAAQCAKQAKGAKRTRHEGYPEVHEALASLFRTYEALYGVPVKIRKRRDLHFYEGPLFEFVRTCTREQPLKIDWHSDEAMGKAIDRELRLYRQSRYLPRT